MGLLHNMNNDGTSNKSPERDTIELKMGKLIADDKLAAGVDSSLASDKEENNANEANVERGLLPNNLEGKDDNDALISNVTESTQTTFDVNLYQQKKTLAQGMMDLALLSANANQLRTVLDFPADRRGGFFFVSLTLILASLLLQVAVGIGLIWNGRYNIKKSCDHPPANRANNWTLMGIFLITITNILIPAFTAPSPSQTSLQPSAITNIGTSSRNTDPLNWQP